MAVSRDAVAWGARLLLGREPDDGTPLHLDDFDSVESLRTSLLRRPEAKTLFEAANGADGPREAGATGEDAFAIPPFLLRRPSSHRVPWRFEEPDLDDPVCQLCTAEQMAGAAYRDACLQLGLDPGALHRKLWEFAYILSALRRRGMLAPGRRGLGFGTGKEPLPSAFAAAGVAVLATDAPSDLEFRSGWEQTNQWARSREQLWHPDLVDRETFLARVRFEVADMNSIPDAFRDFDFCWSACCFEHLGSIRKGLDFLHRSLDTLKPGGVSVQTTEFNLGSDEETIEEADLCLFRRRDIETVIEELVREGHRVEPLNLWPGLLPQDQHVDAPPYSPLHLKLRLQDFVTTSLGLIITKAG